VKKLLFSVTADDCVMDVFRSGGPGGQHQNKSSTGVRFRHKPSGAFGECRRHRSQAQNKKEAWTKLGNNPKFRAWLRIKVAERGGKTIDELVEEAMQEKNLLIEVLNENKKWVKFVEEGEK